MTTVSITMLFRDIIYITVPVLHIIRWQKLARLMKLVTLRLTWTRCCRASLSFLRLVRARAAAVRRLGIRAGEESNWEGRHALHCRLDIDCLGSLVIGNQCQYYTYYCTVDVFDSTACSLSSVLVLPSQALNAVRSPPPQVRVQTDQGCQAVQTPATKRGYWDILN